MVGVHVGAQEVSLQRDVKRAVGKWHPTRCVWELQRDQVSWSPTFLSSCPLPQELRALVRRHQKDLYDIWLRAAAPALLTLAADPQYVGGLIGVLCVLHTWTRALVYHPHVHFLVPAGGVSADRTEGQPARPTSLVPVQALSQIFRGRFRDLVRQVCPDLSIPESVWTREWVVYGQPAVPGTEPVLRSLGRYVHRIALTNSRILSLEDGHFCFRYQDSRLTAGRR